jgi:hypothetical protein
MKKKKGSVSNPDSHLIRIRWSPGSGAAFRNADPDPEGAKSAPKKEKLSKKNRKI